MSIGLKTQTSSSVPTPPSGEQNYFVDSADDKLKKKMPDTSVVEIEVNAANPDASDVVVVPSGNISSTNVQDAINELDSEKAPIGHVGSGGISQHPAVTGLEAGFMSPSDKTKLDGISSGATANDTDANLKNRANHTGTQAASTISDFDSAADARANISMLAHLGASDPHAQYATDSDLSSHTSNTSNPHAVTKAQVGLGNVDNTSDMNKPVSTAQAAADSTVLSTAEAYTDSAIASLVAASPSQLDTLQELADALGNDSNFAATTATALGNRLRVDTSSQGLSSGQKLNAKTNIDLQNVDNTSDLNKPVSTAQAAADSAATAAAQATSLQKSANLSDLGSLTTAKTNLGINNVDNTSDMNKPVSTAQAAAIATKATDPTTTDGDIIARISGVLSRIGIGGEDFILRSVGGIPSWQEENLGQDLGGGSDGSVTLTGALTAPDNLYYQVLTMGAGGVLNTDAYILYARTLDLTNAQAGAFSRNGNAGTNGANNNSGQAGGTAYTVRVLGTNSAGGAGAAGSANAGVQGAAGAAVIVGNGGNGGTAGASGAGGTGAGAGAISGGAVSTNIHFDRFEYNFIRGVTQVYGGAGGRGGSSGGGDGANISRGGAGGGAGGGVLVIIAGEIITGPSTPAGVFQAKGGLGGTQSNPPTTGNVGGPGGAGGGGGGYIYCAYVKKTGPVVSNLFDASGGNGGNGGPALGTGVPGNGGGGGNGGRIQFYNITTGIGTLITGTAGIAGTVAVGSTPGLGGAGGVCQASL